MSHKLCSTESFTKKNNSCQSAIALSSRSCVVKTDLTHSVPEGLGQYRYENSMTRGITLQHTHSHHMKKSKENQCVLTSFY